MSGPFRGNRATHRGVELQDREEVCVAVSQHVASARCQARTPFQVSHVQISLLSLRWCPGHTHDRQLTQNSEPLRAALPSLTRKDSNQASSIASFHTLAFGHIRPVWQPVNSPQPGLSTGISVFCVRPVNT